MLSIEMMLQLPLPTPEQHQAFVNHLCDVHSWYKHLPLLTGGEFVVFLTPDAGLDYPSEHPRLPYGNTPDGYRRAFGYLDYMWRIGDAAFDRDGGKPLILPELVLQQCRFTLYPYVACEFYWGIHADAIARLQAGSVHPQRDRLLEWEAVAGELECLEGEPVEAPQVALLEARATSLHSQLRAQEVTKIEQHLHRLYEDCGIRAK